MKPILRQTLLHFTGEFPSRISESTSQLLIIVGFQLLTIILLTICFHNLFGPDVQSQNMHNIHNHNLTPLKKEIVLIKNGDKWGK